MRPVRGKAGWIVGIKDAGLPVRCTLSPSRDGRQEWLLSYIDALERDEVMDYIRRLELLAFLDDVTAA